MWEGGGGSAEVKPGAVTHQQRPPDPLHGLVQAARQLLACRLHSRTEFPSTSSVHLFEGGAGPSPGRGHMVQPRHKRRKLANNRSGAVRLLASGYRLVRHLRRSPHQVLLNQTPVEMIWILAVV